MVFAQTGNQLNGRYGFRDGEQAIDLDAVIQRLNLDDSQANG